MCPLPTTQVFDRRWSGWHRPVAEGQMTATCTITRPVSPGVFDETAGRTLFQAPTAVYDGQCRVQVAQRPRSEVLAGDAQLSQDRYAVCVPAGADGIQVNDQLTLTECANDTTLVGVPMRVVEIVQGTLIWQRDLTCELLMPATR